MSNNRKVIIMLLFYVTFNIFAKTQEIIKPLGLSEEFILVEKNNKKEFWNQTGKRVFNFIYEDAQLFSENLAGVRNNNKLWGYINKQGKIIVEYKYDEVTPFYNNIAIIRAKGKYGIIDINGKEVVTPKYDYIYNFNEKLAKVEVKGKYGIIDINGKEIVTPKYDYVNDFKKGIASFSIKDKWGCIDKNGKEIIIPKYDDIGNFSNGLAYVKKGNKYGYIDESGNIKINFDYEDATEFTEKGFAIVRKSEIVYIIDKKEKVIKKIGEIEGNIEMFGIKSSLTSTYPTLLTDETLKNKLEVSSFIREDDGTLVAKEISNKGGVYSYDAIFDNDGNQITPFKYYFYDEGALSSVDDYQYVLPEFINENCVVRIGNYDEQLGEMNFLYGLIDKTGKEIIPPEYSWIYNSTGDTGLVVDKTSSKLGVYNIKDNKLSIKWIFTGIVDI